MQGWKAVAVVGEGTPVHVRGLNLWDHEWHRVQGESLELPHPAYPHQRHQMLVYQVGDGSTTITFAAGELSANVWGFYVPA